MSEGYCNIHNVDMKELTNSNTGEKFWSHYTEDTKYPIVGKAGKRCCNGKPPKGEKEVKNTVVPKEQMRCKIWEIAWRVFPNDPEARNQCMRQGESFIFSGELNDKFEYEGEK